MLHVELECQVKLAQPKEHEIDVESVVIQGTHEDQLPRRVSRCHIVVSLRVQVLTAPVESIVRVVPFGLLVVGPLRVVEVLLSAHGKIVAL